MNVKMKSFHSDKAPKVLDTFVSHYSWVALLFICILMTNTLWDHIGLIAAFNVVYFSLALALFFMEKKFTFRKEWLEPDQQFLPDLLHTIMSKGFVQAMTFIILYLEFSKLMSGPALWPTKLGFAWQVILALIIAEFGLYWAHRICHEIKVLWPFHAIHHSVTRLWFWNTGRFHFVDALLSMVMGTVPLIIIGTPTEVLAWYGMITAFIGMLTHCNVNMECGVLNNVFNTPNLHRWHHAPNGVEGNTNYGENLVLWDQLFGTFYNPKLEPPMVIGVKNEIPDSFVSQLRYPFQEIKKIL